MKTKSILIVALVILSTTIFSQTWSSVGVGSGNNIMAMASDPTNLYVGQQNTPVSNGVIVWNGSTITNPMSINVNVSAMCVYNNEVYVGYSNGQGIAKWNGSSWVNLGVGLTVNPIVYSMCVYNSELYVGGKFGTAGGNSAANIAKWNGSSWSAVDAGLGGSNPAVYSMCVYNSELYVGGKFTTMGSSATSCTNIAKWNGSSWSLVGVGINTVGTTPGIRALEVYNSELYAGGSIVNTLNKWDGSSWSAVTGVTGIVYSLKSFGNELYAGGSTTISSIPNIARYNGSSWSTVGTGVNNTVYSMCIYKNELYAAGTFTLAGGIGVNHIAKWNNNVTTNIDENENIKVKIYPNPVVTDLIIESDINNNHITLTDLTGKELDGYDFNNSTNINMSKYQNGIYFVQINNNKEVTKFKIVKTN